ncbi:MAG: DedA family protein [Rubrobacter sp.]
MERFFDPETISSVLEAIESYGYLFIVLGAMLQGMGLPLPAQTILVSAGVMAGQDILNPYYAILFGLLGAVAGSQAGYFIGRRGGRPFVLKVGRYVGITPRRLDRAEGFFDHHGQRAVLVARFIPVLKTFGYVAAGLVKMPHTVFFRNDLIGTTVWTVGSVLLGMALSEGITAVIS